MTSDEQEAQSTRYVDSIRVLPLSSGRIALLGPRCELYKIVEDWLEVLSNIEELKQTYRYAEKTVKTPSIKVDVDL